MKIKNLIICLITHFSIVTSELVNKKQKAEQKTPRIEKLSLAGAVWRVPSLQEQCIALIIKHKMDYNSVPNELKEKLDACKKSFTTKFKDPHTIHFTKPVSLFCFSQDGSYLIYGYDARYWALHIPTEKQRDLNELFPAYTPDKITFSLDGTNAYAHTGKVRNNITLITLPDDHNKPIEKKIIGHSNIFYHADGTNKDIMKMLFHVGHRMLCCFIDQFNKNNCYVCQNHQQEPPIWKQLIIPHITYFSPSNVWYNAYEGTFFTTSYNYENGRYNVQLWNDQLVCTRTFSSTFQAADELVFTPDKILITSLSHLYQCILGKEPLVEKLYHYREAKGERESCIITSSTISIIKEIHPDNRRGISIIASPYKNGVIHYASMIKRSSDIITSDPNYLFPRSYFFWNAQAGIVGTQSSSTSNDIQLFSVDYDENI
ncbi:MAG TPA: hypothetical protein VEK38_00665 [Candidatus Bathyarchaeia archaeon]|nr:hypothetical protein [Candidatus Bathyarchaeia archaeon]